MTSATSPSDVAAEVSGAPADTASFGASSGADASAQIVEAPAEGGYGAIRLKRSHSPVPSPMASALQALPSFAVSTVVTHEGVVTHVEGEPLGLSLPVPSGQPSAVAPMGSSVSPLPDPMTDVSGQVKRPAASPQGERSPSRARSEPLPVGDEPLRQELPPLDNGLADISSDLGGIWDEDNARAFDEQTQILLQDIASRERQMAVDVQETAPPQQGEPSSQQVVQEAPLPSDVVALHALVRSLQVDLTTALARVDGLEKAEDVSCDRILDLQDRLAMAEELLQSQQEECERFVQTAIRGKEELHAQVVSIQASHEHQLTAMRASHAKQLAMLQAALKALGKQRDEAEAHGVALSATVRELRLEVQGMPSRIAVSHQKPDVVAKPVAKSQPTTASQSYVPGAMLAKLRAAFEEPLPGAPGVNSARGAASGHVDRVCGAQQPVSQSEAQAQQTWPRTPPPVLQKHQWPPLQPQSGGSSGGLVGGTALAPMSGASGQLVARQPYGGGSVGGVVSGSSQALTSGVCGQPVATCAHNASQLHPHRGLCTHSQLSGGFAQGVGADDITFGANQGGATDMPGNDSVDHLSSDFSRLRLALPIELRNSLDVLQAAASSQQNASRHAQGLQPVSSLAPAPRPDSQASVFRYRETDVVAIPALPASPLDMKTWAMSVLNSVQAASGRAETASLRSWLGECRLEIANPDVHFDTHRTPREFVSLESKLNVGLRNELGSARDKSLIGRILREDNMRFDRGMECWGGRRVFYEVLRFYQLSEDRLQEQALMAFWNMRWLGDDFAQVCQFQNDLLRVTEAASRSGMRDGQITAKLAEVLRGSARLGPKFLAYEEAHRTSGMLWRDLVEIVNRDVENERRDRLSASLAVGHTSVGKPRKPRAETNPAGPAIGVDGVDPAHAAILRKHAGYCRDHLCRVCTRQQCRFSHAALPPADAIALRAALNAKYGDRSGASSVVPSPPSVSQRAVSEPDSPRISRFEPGLCKLWQKGEACPNAPNCRWRHGPGQAELTRAKALRAKERAERQASSSVVGATKPDAPGSPAAAAPSPSLRRA